MEFTALQERLPLGQMLLEEGLITQEQLRRAMDEQKLSGTRLGDILLREGWIQSHEIYATLADQLNLPFVDLLHYPLKAEQVHRLPERHARRHRTIVVEEYPDGRLLLGVSHPENLYALDHLAELLQVPLSFVVVDDAALDQVFSMYYGKNEAIEHWASQVESSRSTERSDSEWRPEEDISPVAELARLLFEQALALNASDIHLEPMQDHTRFRFRVDGVLQEHTVPFSKSSGALIQRFKLMAGLDISETRLPQDGAFRVALKHATLDARMSTLPSVYGEALVLRLLKEARDIPSLPSLGMDEALIERMQRWVHHPHGLILVTGPTGSGKTTTLYSMLKEITHPSRKIITIEDPVEYRLDEIQQIQANARIDLGFARVLRSVLRHDPDVVMIGEIRDGETAEMALRAALTGHLVLGTVHTNDARSSFLRLTDLGCQPSLIEAVCLGVLAQRLLRKNCPRCSTPSTKEAGLPGKGCIHCHHTGYWGRLALFEWIECGDRAAQGPSFNEAALKRRREGMISSEEMRRVFGVL